MAGKEEPFTSLRDRMAAFTMSSYLGWSGAALGGIFACWFVVDGALWTSLLFVFSEGPSLEVSEGVCAEDDIDGIRHVSFGYHVAPPSSGVLLAEGGGGDTGVTRGRSRARVCVKKCRRRCQVVVKTNFSA